MTKIFTQHDLIRYIYRETSEKEEKAIKNALLTDSELLAMYNELCDMKGKLESTRMEPSSRTLLNILSYAKAVKAKE